jgi:hypothetical protein
MLSTFLVSILYSEGTSFDSLTEPSILAKYFLAFFIFPGKFRNGTLSGADLPADAPLTVYLGSLYSLKIVFYMQGTFRKVPKRLLF